MDERTAIYTLHHKFDNNRQIGKITLNPNNRPTLYGVKIDFDNPQKEISAGNGIIAYIARFNA